MSKKAKWGIFGLVVVGVGTLIVQLRQPEALARLLKRRS